MKRLIVTLIENDGLTMSAKLGHRVVMFPLKVPSAEVSAQLGRLIMGLVPLPVGLVEIRWLRK